MTTRVQTRSVPRLLPALLPIMLLLLLATAFLGATTATTTTLFTPQQTSSTTYAWYYCDSTTLTSATPECFVDGPAVITAHPPCDVSGVKIAQYDYSTKFSLQCVVITTTTPAGGGSGDSTSTITLSTAPTTDCPTDTTHPQPDPVYDFSPTTNSAAACPTSLVGVVDSAVTWECFDTTTSTWSPCSSISNNNLHHYYCDETSCPTELPKNVLGGKPGVLQCGGSANIADAINIVNLHCKDVDIICPAEHKARCQQYDWHFVLNGVTYGNTTAFRQSGKTCDVITECQDENIMNPTIITTLPSTTTTQCIDLTTNVVATSDIGCGDKPNWSTTTTTGGGNETLWLELLECPVHGESCQKSWKCQDTTLTSPSNNNFVDCSTLSNSLTCDMDTCTTNPTTYPPGSPAGLKATSLLPQPQCVDEHGAIFALISDLHLLSCTPTLKTTAEESIQCTTLCPTTTPPDPVDEDPITTPEWRYKYITTREIRDETDNTIIVTPEQSELFSSATLLITQHPPCDDTCSGQQQDIIIANVNFVLNDIVVICVNTTDIENNLHEIAEQYCLDDVDQKDNKPVSPEDEILFECPAIGLSCDITWLCATFIESDEEEQGQQHFKLVDCNALTPRDICQDAFTCPNTTPLTAQDHPLKQTNIPTYCGVIGDIINTTNTNTNTNNNSTTNGIGYGGCTLSNQVLVDATIDALECTAPCVDVFAWYWVSNDSTPTHLLSKDVLTLNYLCDLNDNWNNICEANVSQQDFTPQQDAYVLKCADVTYAEDDGSNNNINIKNIILQSDTHQKCQSLSSTKPSYPTGSCSCTPQWFCRQFGSTSGAFTTSGCTNPTNFGCDQTQCNADPPVVTRKESKQCGYGATGTTLATTRTCSAFVYPAEATCECSTTPATPTWRCVIDVSSSTETTETVWDDEKEVPCGVTCNNLYENHLEAFVDCSAAEPIGLKAFCIRPDGVEATDPTTECGAAPPTETVECPRLCRHHCAVPSTAATITTPPTGATDLAKFTAQHCVQSAGYCNGLTFCDAFDAKALCYKAKSVTDGSVTVWEPFNTTAYSTTCGPNTFTPYTCLKPPACADTSTIVISNIRFTETTETSTTTLYYRHSKPVLSFQYTGPVGAVVATNLKHKTNTTFSYNLATTTTRSAVEVINLNMLHQLIPYTTLFDHHSTMLTGTNFYFQIEVVDKSTSLSAPAPQDVGAFTVATFCQYQRTLPADKFCSGHQGATCEDITNNCVCPQFPVMYIPQSYDCTCPDLTRGCNFSSQCGGEEGVCGANGFPTYCMGTLALCQCYGNWVSGRTSCDTCPLTCGTSAQGTPNSSCTKCLCKPGAAGPKCQYTTTIAIGLVLKTVPLNFAHIRSDWEAEFLANLAAIMGLDPKYFSITNIIFPSAGARDVTMKLNVNIVVTDSANPALTRALVESKLGSVTHEKLNASPATARAGGIVYQTICQSAVQCSQAELSVFNSQETNAVGMPTRSGVAVMVLSAIVAAIVVVMF